MKKYKSQDRLIFLSVLVLSILGIVMVGSASIGAATTYGSKWAILNIIKQIVFSLIGLIIMIIVSRLYTNSLINKNTWFTFFCCIGGSLLICLAWPAEKGSRAWIRGLPLGMTLQPSEFCKILLVLLLAYFFVDMPKKYPVRNMYTYSSAQRYEEAKKRHITQCYIKPLVVIATEILIVAILQSDKGTAIITLLICLMSFFTARDKLYSRFQGWMVGLLFIVLITSPLWFQFIIKGYMKSRFITWLNPLVDVTGESLQVANALIAITNGGLFGVGLGNSTQKFGYIPEAHNDFISSIIFEELGIFGLALIMIPYIIIIFRLLSYARKAIDPKTTIILTGIASYFFLHLFINIGGVSGLIPMTGVPLLFVSAGGSSILSAFFAIGVAQALISRENKLARELAQN